MLLPKGNKGFTLTEVIIVIAIVGLVSVIAVPSINSFLPGYRLRAATRDMVSFLREARLQAVKQGRSCQIGSGLVVNGRRWDFVAWIDRNGSGDFDGGEQVLTYALSDYPKIALDGLDLDLDEFRFNPRGILPSAVLTGQEEAKIHFRNDRQGKKAVAITLAGAVRVLQ